MKNTESGFELEVDDLLRHHDHVYAVLRVTKTLAICDSNSSPTLRVHKLSNQKNMNGKQIFHIHGNWGFLVYDEKLNKANN